ARHLDDASGDRLVGGTNQLVQPEWRLPAREEHDQGLHNWESSPPPLRSWRLCLVVVGCPPWRTSGSTHSPSLRRLLFPRMRNPVSMQLVHLPARLPWD